MLWQERNSRLAEHGLDDLTHGAARPSLVTPLQLRVLLDLDACLGPDEQGLGCWRDGVEDVDCRRGKGTTRQVRGGGEEAKEELERTKRGLRTVDQLGWSC